MEYPELIQASEEAQLFIQDARHNAESLKMFPYEHFVELQAAVLGGTGIDLQGEAQQSTDLQKVADHIKMEPFWITVNHDPAIHPMGRVLSARLFYSKERDIWFLAGLIGKYDASRLPGLNASLGAQESIPAAEGFEGDEAYVCFNSFEFPETGVRELISDAPECISNKIYDERRKSGIVVVTLLSLIVPAAFLEGFNKKVGEAAGDKFVELMSWLAKKGIKKIRKFSEEAKILTEFYIGPCKVQFLINSGSEAIQIEAAEAIPDNVQGARVAVAQLLVHDPERLVLEYDEERKKWVPLYAVTKRAGVITDRPYLTIVHAQGLSLASRASSPRELAQENQN